MKYLAKYTHVESGTEVPPRAAFIESGRHSRGHAVKSESFPICLFSEKNCSEVVCPEEAEKCPEDSYRLPSYKSPEDCCSTPQSCQCLPKECEERVCPPGERPRTVRPGNHKPGTCCPLFECVPEESEYLRTPVLAVPDDTEDEQPRNVKEPLKRTLRFVYSQKRTILAWSTAPG